MVDNINMNIKLCIPSYKRPFILSSSTLNIIKDLGLPIYVFLKDMEEYRTYTAEPQHPSINIKYVITGTNGIGQKRNFIRHYFPIGEKIVMLDDDINEIKQKDNADFNLKNFLEEMFLTMEREETKFAGICLYDNTYFMKDGYSTKLKYCGGCLMAEIIREDKIITPLDQFEDFYYSLKCFEKDKKIIRFNNIYVKTKYYNPSGGICDAVGGLENRKKICEQISKDLVALYPKAMSRYLKKDGIWNIRLNHRFIAVS